MWSYFKFIIVLLYAKATFVLGFKVSSPQKYYEEDYGVDWRHREGTILKYEMYIFIMKRGGTQQIILEELIGNYQLDLF